MADLRGSGTRPLRIQILSFSCSFRGKFRQIIGFCIHLGNRLGNPGSTTAKQYKKNVDLLLLVFFVETLLFYFERSLLQLGHYFYRKQF